jgi:hypothetical protein
LLAYPGLNEIASVLLCPDGTEKLPVGVIVPPVPLVLAVTV